MTKQEISEAIAATKHDKDLWLQTVQDFSVKFYGTPLSGHVDAEFEDWLYAHDRYAYKY